ncbi:DUF975 family protein [Fructobacillus sp. W13]|uniref:DUF975 family protein n=1 Tax=Fructobacillus apis TaxID=2935017 RepID=A0ABT0ZP63_9LACO|nr:DUF975 family protein [Fructobacillus apis]MCO0831791.1 DUF975 family protein [Fructobacillus apis]
MTKAEIRRQIKAQAKDKLQGNWVYALLITLPAFIFDWAGSPSDFDSTFTDMANGYGFTFPVGAVANASVMNILGFFATTAAMFALLNFFRSEKREAQPFLQTINAYGESKGLFVGTLVIGILQMVFTTLWALLLLVPGIIKSFSYSQALFIYKDAKAAGEEISYTDALTRSRQMMDGHKWELFVIYLSFIGWMILANLAFGLGNIILLPYMYLTIAGFYNHLKDEAAKGSEDVTSEA